MAMRRLRHLPAMCMLALACYHALSSYCQCQRQLIFESTFFPLRHRLNDRDERCQSWHITKINVLRAALCAACSRELLC